MQTFVNEITVNGLNYNPAYYTSNDTIDTAEFYVVAKNGVTSLTMPGNGSVLIKNISGNSINLVSTATFDGNASPLVVVDDASYLLIYNSADNDWSIN